MIINSKVGLKKGYSIRMSQYFLPHSYERSGRNVKCQLDISIYETKADMKGTSMWTSKTDMASLKTKKDDRSIDDINNLTADLKNISNVVDNDVVRKIVQDQLIIKPNAVDAKIASNRILVTKTQYDLDKQDPERKVKDVVKKTVNTNELAKKTGYSTKIKEIENNISNVTGLETTVAIKTNATEVENKIPDTTGFITTSGFTEATKISFDARM